MRYFLKIKLKVVSLPTDVPNFDFMKTKDSVWKTLSSEYIFRRPWLTVRHDDMELPNGNRIPEYYILEYPDWVNMIAITRDDRFIFVRQYRPGIARTAMNCAPEYAKQKTLHHWSPHNANCWKRPDMETETGRNTW